jgi:nucleotide-binding universal stress UspA family protein
MKAILCGTDFSDHARRAAQVAAALAHKLGCPLRLLHVVEAIADDEAESGTGELVLQARRKTLEEQAQALRTQSGSAIEAITVTGRVFEQVIREGRACGAGLLVVASLGRGQPHGWHLGSTAERIAQHSSVPVLVVREAQPLLDWIAGADVLPVTVCADMTHASRAALHWARELHRIGPCEIELTYIAWPPAERSLAGTSESTTAAEPWAALEANLADDLRMWAADTGPGASRESYRVLVNWGRTDAAITQHATGIHSALIVAGTHRRSYVARLWQGSVTRSLLHHAETNVVCVPPSEFGSARVAVIKRVLAAVDLSDMDAEVVRTALGVAPQDGEVHLLHVIEPHSDKKAEHAARERLEALLAPSQHVRRAVTHLVVRPGESPHTVIATYAERMAADAICMGMKKRSRAADLLLGSQSHGVIRSARVPVILVPTDQGVVAAM